MLKLLLTRSFSKSPLASLLRANILVAVICSGSAVAQQTTQQPQNLSDTNQATNHTSVKPSSDEANISDQLNSEPEISNSQTLEQAAAERDFHCKVETESRELVDRVRASTHTRLCNTVGWLDGLFGKQEHYKGEEFRGKISLGFREDEAEGLDPRLRVRIKAKLPNVSKRFDAFLGRVEEDSYIANTEVNEDRVNNVGLRSTNDEDSEWLVGLGYRGPSEDYNGWDYSVGAKISSGFRPYAKAAYRSLFQINSDNYWKTTQTVFWRKRDGLGVSSNTDYTRLIGDNDIWVTHGSVKYTEEAEQVEWFADTRWHHSFSSKRGISSSVYARGEAENEIPIPEYGVTFTYIQPVLRDWLYLETGLDWRWERQTREQRSYKSAVRFGIQLEMLLGDYYQRGKRRKFLVQEPTLTQ